MTKKTFRALALGALATSLVLTGCASGGTSTGETVSPAASEQTSVQRNAADEMFATMMIPHHEQAIAMSDIVLAKPDVAPEVLDLAQRIKDAQGPEIEQLQTWLEEWDVRSEDGMGHMDGMMSEDDMAALESAAGAEASRLFLQQMIAHHEGAVAMAETEVEQGSHPDVVAMAQAIIDAQQAEIAEMQQLLTEL